MSAHRHLSAPAEINRPAADDGMFPTMGMQGMRQNPRDTAGSPS